MEPSFYGMRADQAIDVAQTVAIIIAIYYVTVAFRQFRREGGRMADILSEVLKDQRENSASLERVWKRIEDIENLHGIRSDMDGLAQMRIIVDAIQKALNIQVNDNRTR